MYNSWPARPHYRYAIYTLDGWSMRVWTRIFVTFNASHRRTYTHKRHVSVLDAINSFRYIDVDENDEWLNFNVNIYYSHYRIRSFQKQSERVCVYKPFGSVNERPKDGLSSCLMSHLVWHKWDLECALFEVFVDHFIHFLAAIYPSASCVLGLNYIYIIYGWHINVCGYRRCLGFAIFEDFFVMLSIKSQFEQS